ncbi:MAG: hypothetical protein ABIO79_16350 [Ferruginibacter sp.]
MATKMEKLTVTIIYLLVTFLSYGQDNSKQFAELINRGDSLFKNKDYKSAAIVFSSAIDLAYPNQGNAVNNTRWKSTRSWTLANEADSAFVQLNKIFSTNKVYPYFNKRIIIDKDLTSLHTDKRWRPLIDSILNEFKISIDKDILAERLKPNFHVRYTYSSRYDAAWVWALMKDSDSAFYNLDIIASDSWNSLYEVIKDDNAFFSLYNDSRWPLILERLKQNYYPLQGRHNNRGPYIPMVLTIDSASSYFKSDGLGSYRDGIDSIESGEQTAFNFRIRNVEKILPSPRSVILNLSNPLPGSRAVSQGIIHDNQSAEIHVFYKWDRSVKPWIVYNLRDVPIGTTIESPRTEIRVSINGILHILQLGPYCLGDGNEPYAYGGHIGGEGTTKVLVTRNSKTSYTIIAPVESIGRLWNVSSWVYPIDKGLFKTGFIIHLEYQ